MPSPSLTLSRRQVLVGAAALALLGASVSACGSSSEPPPEVAELEAQLDRARADSQLATDAAAVAKGDTAEALTTVASERSAHAQALSDELVRMRGADTPTSTTSSPPSPTETTAEPAKAPTAKDVIEALRTSAGSAAGLAAKMSGYRAGLLGSIAAACAAAYSVALAPQEQPQ